MKRHKFLAVVLISLSTGIYAQVFDKTQKDASSATQGANEALYSEYSFNDKMSFKEASKGRIAGLPKHGIVKNADGKVVWNFSAFSSFIKKGEKAPATANPSLWRQSQLLMISGLFEVVPGVYQVRGADLSNMTIIEGDNGITIYDPLISTECAKYALDLYYANRPKKPVVAVVFSHSHVDHFGGINGVVSAEDVAAGKVKIYAPEGFLEHAIQENVFAGTAMSRRAGYMYGNAVDPGVKGQIGAGLGITTSTGTVTIMKPTNIISKTGQKEVIDGLEYHFIMAPGSESPSEMMWYLPKYKMINAAEDAVHTMHNLYTLRGAKTRDASQWPIYLNQVLQTWGDSAEVVIGMHHWPVWGHDRLIQHIKSQRDTYKFLHDQTLHFANMGYTINELPQMVEMPQGLVKQWGTHGYYGSKSHNVRAVYNYYLGYFDGNPAHLDPLPNQEVAKKYVAAIGGTDKMMKLGTQALQEGEYRWGAELMNHLVFAQPDNIQAKYLQADLLEQMGYQAESGPWRNFYLAGAYELRNGVSKKASPNTASVEIISNMSLDLVFGYMGIQLNAKKAIGKNITINWIFADTKQNYTTFLENSVLNYWPNSTVANSDVSVTMDRTTLNSILSGSKSFQNEIKNGAIKLTGNPSKLMEVFSCLENLNAYISFNIITP